MAVRFPSDRIAQELIKAAGGYVAAPSANTSGRPSPTTAQHVEEDLGEAIEMIIDLCFRRPTAGGWVRYSRLMQDL